jgi:hypothetical protein
VKCCNGNLCACGPFCHHVRCHVDVPSSITRYKLGSEAKERQQFPGCRRRGPPLLLHLSAVGGRRCRPVSWSVVTRLLRPARWQLARSGGGARYWRNAQIEPPPLQCTNRSTLNRSSLHRSSSTSAVEAGAGGEQLDPGRRVGVGGGAQPRLPPQMPEVSISISSAERAREASSISTPPWALEASNSTPAAVARLVLMWCGSVGSSSGGAGSQWRMQLGRRGDSWIEETREKSQEWGSEGLEPQNEDADEGTAGASTILIFTSFCRCDGVWGSCWSQPKELMITSLLFCDFNLIYLYKCVHNHH